jgi:hypothetical protein
LDSSCGKTEVYVNSNNQSGLDYINCGDFATPCNLLPYVWMNNIIVNQGTIYLIGQLPIPYIFRLIILYIIVYINLILAAGVTIPYDITVKLEGFLPSGVSYEEDKLPIVMQSGNADYWIHLYGSSSTGTVNLTFQHIKLILNESFSGIWFFFFLFFFFCIFVFCLGFQLTGTTITTILLIVILLSKAIYHLQLLLQTQYFIRIMENSELQIVHSME